MRETVLIPFEQPKRYGSMRKARSPALFLALKGPIAGDSTRGRWHLACFGNLGHYQRGTGICTHVEGWVACLGDWHKARLRFLPFGDNARSVRRLESRRLRNETVS